jgi:hypothetical protein
VLFQVVIIAILAAIDIVFDSCEISLLKGKAWQPEHILLVRPYLVATAEHLCIALALFENPVMTHHRRPEDDVPDRGQFAYASGRRYGNAVSLRRTAWLVRESASSSSQQA